MGEFSAVISCHTATCQKIREASCSQQWPIVSAFLSHSFCTQDKFISGLSALAKMSFVYDTEVREKLGEERYSALINAVEVKAAWLIN